MIINTGQRTDIPAFYSEWFSNRLKAGLLFRMVFKPTEGRLRLGEESLQSSFSYPIPVIS